MWYIYENSQDERKEERQLHICRVIDIAWWDYYVVVYYTGAIEGLSEKLSISNKNRYFHSYENNSYL